MSKNTLEDYVDLLSEIHDVKTFWNVFHWDYPLEIRCGAIDPSGVHKDLYGAQVNTSKGLWDLHAIPKSKVQPDQLREFLEKLEERHRPQPVLWTKRSPTIVGRMHFDSSEVSITPSATIEDHVADVEETLDDWRSSPSKLLAKLQDPLISRDELFDAILFAEIENFDESQTVQLLTRLFAFVSEYRLLQEDIAKTAVGAAIRKLAMNLQDSQIEQYADLFLPTDTETLPCEIELELAKVILWRLTNAPASLSREFPELERRLAELALDYLKPRLILQRNYASVALQASLGVLLLNGQHADSVLKSVKDLGIGWFTELFQRRLQRLQKQLVEAGNTCSEAVATKLSRFVAEFEDVQGESDTTACQLGD